MLRGKHFVLSILGERHGRGRGAGILPRRSRLWSGHAEVHMLGLAVTEAPVPSGYEGRSDPYAGRTDSRRRGYLAFWSIRTTRFLRPESPFFLGPLLLRT